MIRKERCSMTELDILRRKAMRALDKVTTSEQKAALRKILNDKDKVK